MLLLIAVFLIALNLRMAITAVGPLLDQIAASHQISAALLGLLGALPLLVWGLVSPFAHSLSVRFGSTHTLTAALLVLMLGTVWRSLPGPVTHLWVGTALIGAGLAICNALLPAVFKREFPSRVPLLMGCYSAFLGLTAAIGAGFSVPLSLLNPSSTLTGWQFSLLMFGFPLPVALVVWAFVGRRSRRATPHASDPIPATRPPTFVGRRIWADPLAWQVSFYMGAQSAIFYAMASWLAPYAVSLGTSPVQAGVLVMIFSGLGMFGSLALPFATRNAVVHRIAPSALAGIMLLCLVGIALAPAAMLVWIVIAGLTGGASFTVALTLMAERARTAEHATALSGMGQSIGYIIAAIGPFAFGSLLDISGGWVAPFALLWLCAIGQLSLGVSVGKPRYVLTSDESHPA